MGWVGRAGFSAVLMLALTGSPVLGQSQSDKTGVGSVAVAGQETTSVLMHPLVVGTVFAAVIGIAIAVTSSDDSAIVSTATTTSTTTR